MAEELAALNRTAPRRFKPYPRYRDSGVEWLGSIPADWKVQRLKYVAPARSDRLDTKPEEAIYVGLENVQSWTGRLLLDSQPESVDSVVTAFEAGDVLFGKLRPYLAKAARPNFSGVCTSEILALRPTRGCLQGYLMYRLLDPGYVRWIDSLTYGTKMPRVGPEQVGNCPVGFPSMSEQRAIATFLDRETTGIDALVAHKEQLIELLAERRTALIMRAVRRGLNPNVPMKDSGIEWLGAIPAHWEIARLKTLLVRCDYGISETLQGIGSVRVLTMTHVQDGEVVLPEIGSVDDIDDGLILERNDIVFNRTNSRELVAKAGIFRGSREDGVTFASYLVRLRVKRGVSPHWLNYLLNSSGVLGIARSMALLSVNQANLNPTKYGQVALPVPPKDEQCAIAQILDRETARIDALVARIRDAIDRLKELRTAIISAAVTGKIDVRSTDIDVEADDGAVS